MLGTLGLFLQQAFGAFGPACGNRARVREVVIADESEGETRSTCPIPSREVGAERSLAGLDALLGRTRPRRRLADQLQIFRIGRCGVRVDEKVVRFAP